ncbi:CRISPR-associated helicase Cas3' [sulfur-oxidizing endosymbiont of Gigantopelta aegis]|uniref:CRISPR-associated helicase Cas3' n=1 Tax=sulfur-oxidizing endosymbiont of Gigantopelta aegis TaxID=2794934 RepID=UPI001FEBFFE1|nr:CRISPR-associated helicase Cas3' [sulfur-oxidizing endosymbiont of Gigantopelta aegis]
MSNYKIDRIKVAHVKLKENDEWDEPHILDDHLRCVKKLAAEFAKDIDPDWAVLSGIWHDLGKYRKRFQDYIRLQSGYEQENAHIENGKRAPHSTAGAIHSTKMLPLGLGHIISYLIAGHHAGLPDWDGGKGSLKYRLVDGIEEYQEALAENIPVDILHGECPELPEVAKSVESISLWMRILFSCLVDADFLDTELYMQPKKSAQRNTGASLELLQTRFTSEMEVLKKNSIKSELNNIRNNILRESMLAAHWQPGLFSLTVPTGGGKTLSSLAFALEHARIHNKKRVIYAIPFTSIIEQNADVFRRFIGDDAVLEHHSSLDVAPNKENNKSRLAAENWDVPLVVTTNVQLFESLFASRTSRCRKLHNLVNSVIILDEAQQIPRDFHAPITQVMQQLSEHFGVTWVLCTATQPVLTESKNTFGQVLLKGLNNVREIVSNPIELSMQLKRVEVKLPAADEPKLSWDELALKLKTEDSVLTIVNTRKQARKLFELLPDDKNNLHLSANMCAQHRTEIIEQIKERLEERRNGGQRPLRVISTQLIEAGVDVDFPVVYRAMAGLDSIAQSAGRCNREGKLKELGKVIVFKAEHPSPPGFLKQGEEITSELIASGQLDEPLSPNSFAKYFSLMNAKGDRDKHGILDLLRASQSSDAPLAIQFRTAAEKFRLIDNNGVSIIVPFKPDGSDLSPVEGWIGQLEADPLQKWVYKKLQRYTVSITENMAKQFQVNGCIDVRAGLFVLLDSFYHVLWGVDTPDILISPEDSVF